MFFVAAPAASTDMAATTACRAVGVGHREECAPAKIEIDIEEDLGLPAFEPCCPPGTGAAGRAVDADQIGPSSAA
ncbi:MULTISPECIES: hypothetical protein [Streptomyces]|uniref:hypothetical protein n=1 Tax=Streptomyces TaxID=1883 RepID=UPI002F26CFAF